MTTGIASITSETTATAETTDAETAASPALLHARLAVAKTSHYATRESGDTAEIAERPDGGFTLVLVDGQGHGYPAKLLSLQLTAKAVSLIKEGVRDGAVARAVHDYLHAYRGGKVSATLDFLTLDLGARSVLLTRNGDVPAIIGRAGAFEMLASGNGPIGVRRHTRPIVTHLDLEAGLSVILYTDGIAYAGERSGTPLDPVATLMALDPSVTGAQELADALLAAAVAADNGRPSDDMAAIALTIGTREERDVIRRMSVDVPLVLRRRDG